MAEVCFWGWAKIRAQALGVLEYARVRVQL